MSGHDWSHANVPVWDEHGASSNQYRVPRSMFENRTPTVVEGLTRDVLGHELGVPSYQTATFEENQQYYSPAEHASGVPVGKERAEDHNQGGRVAGGGR